MRGVIDWPRYSRWTWIVAALLVLLLLLLWWLGRGPGSAVACCGEPIAPTEAVAADEEPVGRVAEPPAEPEARLAQPASSGVGALAFAFEGGKWVLEGAVPDRPTKDRLLKAAVATYGEEAVVDRLRVDTGVAASQCADGPGELFAWLQAAPTVGLTCDGNTVSLTGIVASDEEKTALERWVRDFFGADTRIVNDLQVGALQAQPVAETPAQPVAKAEDVQCAARMAVAVTFASGSSEIDAAGKELLDAVAPCLEDGRYEVSGHTDNVGSAELNARLSQARADAVRTYLMESGVSGDNLTAKGFGADRPIADNATEQGRERNRRIEFSKLPPDAAPSQPPSAGATASMAAASAGDSSRTSVDWPGTYKGTIPCADCPGIDVTLVLAEDGTYERTTFYQDSDDTPETVRGRFTWDATGGQITLDEAGDRQAYRVGEGKVIQLDPGGNLIEGPTADLYVLSKSKE